MPKRRDPRLAPLRAIIYFDHEPADGYRVYATLGCGHRVATTGTTGHGKRMRCESCKHEALRRA